MIHYYKTSSKDKTLKSIKKFKKDSWISVVNPDSKEINFLVRTFGIDRKNIHSGLDSNEVPRIDQSDNTSYIFTKLILPEKRNRLETCLIVISKDFILTLSKNDTKFLKKIRTSDKPPITNEKLRFAVALFSIIDRQFEDTTIEIIKLVQTKKKKIAELNESDVNEVLAQEEVLNNLVDTYSHLTLLYERIIKKIKFYHENKSLLKTLIIEAHQSLNLCQSSLKTISHIRDRYNIFLSNRLNRVITILTIFTIFISLPAAISGLYGMNLRLPLQNNAWAFYYILLLNLIIWGLLFVYFKKKKIL